MANYFGIDLGDGETSATCLFENKIAENLFDPVNVPLKNKESIISAVGMRAGIPVVGDEAIIGGQAVSDVRSRFKSKYLTDPDESKKSISRFAQGIYTILKSQLELDDYELALGCPVGWTESERILNDCVLQSVKDLSPSSTAADIEKAMIEQSEAVFNDHEKLRPANELILEWIPGTLEGEQLYFDNLCSTYKIDKVNLTMSNITGDLVKIDSINISGLFVFVCKIIAAGTKFTPIKEFAKLLVKNKVDAAIDEVI